MERGHGRGRSRRRFGGRPGGGKERRAGGSPSTGNGPCWLFSPVPTGDGAASGPATGVSNAMAAGGGMLNGTDWGLADIKIEKGIIVVDQIGGSRWTNASTLRFRYDSKEDRVSLIGADLSDFDRANGEETVTSTNYLTGDRIVTGRRIEEEGKGMRKVSEKRRKIAVPPIFLEEVDMYSLK